MRPGVVQTPASTPSEDPVVPDGGFMRGLMQLLGAFGLEVACAAAAVDLYVRCRLDRRTISNTIADSDYNFSAVSVTWAWLLVEVWLRWPRLSRTLAVLQAYLKTMKMQPR